MKNNLALGILTVAVIILYILHFSSSNNSTSEVASQKTADTTGAKDSCATALKDTVATEPLSTTALPTSTWTLFLKNISSQKILMPDF